MVEELINCFTVWSKLALTFCSSSVALSRIVLTRIMKPDAHIFKKGAQRILISDLLNAEKPDIHLVFYRIFVFLKFSYST